jgi:hypothetical protein
VPVQMPAFSIVIEQPVAITKLDLARDSKHGRGRSPWWNESFGGFR